MKDNIDELIYLRRPVPLHEFYKAFALRLRIRKRILRKVLLQLQKENAIKIVWTSPRGGHFLVLKHRGDEDE